MKAPPGDTRRGLHIGIISDAFIGILSAGQQRCAEHAAVFTAELGGAVEADVGDVAGLGEEAARRDLRRTEPCCRDHAVREALRLDGHVPVLALDRLRARNRDGFSFTTDFELI